MRKFSGIFGVGGRLHQKIFFMMLAVGIVPIAISGLFVLYSVTNSHRESVASIEENLLNQKADEIGGFLNGTLGTLEIRVPFEQTSDIALPDQAFLLNGLLEQEPSFEDISFISLSTGMETSRATRRHAALSAEPELRDQSNIQKFTVAKGGSNYVGEVYFTSEGPWLTLSAPVRNKNGVVISVLGAEINLAKVERIIKLSKLGSLGYVYAVDESGRVIYGSTSRDFSVPIPGAAHDVLAGNDLTGIDDQRRYDGILGESVVAAGKYLPISRWALMAEWPTNDADSILQRLAFQIIIFSMVALIAIVLLSTVLATRIVKPVKSLEAGTKVVAQGKFDEPIDIKTGDELEDLGVAFNDMSKGLKELQALKDELVFIAAHELKTPVSAIKGYLSIISEGLAGPISDKAKDFLTKSINANTRLIALVEDMLQVARLEATGIKVQVIPVDISEIVNATLSELKPLADEKGIVMNYTGLSDMPRVFADSPKLREVMVNLVGNAIKYTIGSGEVSVSHEVSDGKLITHVKDTGIGIPPAAQAKLFQKFYRVQDEKSKGVSGTGLGLFIVKQLIEKMGGSIWVSSESGKGSVFSFSLLISSKK